jgi:hypothetical protein
MARQVIVSFGIIPDEIAWHVPKDGSLIIGRKHPGAREPTYEQTSHILAWARRERVKVRIMGWEQNLL